MISNSDINNNLGIFWEWQWLKKTWPYWLPPDSPADIESTSSDVATHQPRRRCFTSKSWGPNPSKIPREAPISQLLSSPCWVLSDIPYINMLVPPWLFSSCDAWHPPSSQLKDSQGSTKRKHTVRYWWNICNIRFGLPGSAWNSLPWLVKPSKVDNI